MSTTRCIYTSLILRNFNGVVVHSLNTLWAISITFGKWESKRCSSLKSWDDCQNKVKMWYNFSNPHEPHVMVLWVFNSCNYLSCFTPIGISFTCHFFFNYYFEKTFTCHFDVSNKCLKLPKLPTICYYHKGPCVKVLHVKLWCIKAEGFGFNFDSRL